MGNLEVASYTQQEHHLGDRIFSTRQKSVFFLFSSFSVQMKVRNMIKPLSVTKKNIMDGMDKAFGIVNTPTSDGIVTEYALWALGYISLII